MQKASEWQPVEEEQIAKKTVNGAKAGEKIGSQKFSSLHKGCPEPGGSFTCSPRAVPSKIKKEKPHSTNT